MPIRTCVGCRAQADAAELLRVASVDARAVVDERQVLPGRGAWLHPTSACLELALRRRAVTRALRSDVDTSGLGGSGLFA